MSSDLLRFGMEYEIKIILLYFREFFVFFFNFYIIGIMNFMDRSIVFFDMVFRRCFVFFEILFCFEEFGDIEVGGVNF